MINSSVFDYINVLDRAADASWLRNEAISNNIANVDTPGYKRQDVSFERELQKALRRSGGIDASMDSRVNELKSRDLRGHVYTDHGDYSYRLDDNNVDIDTENVKLAANQIQYNALIQSVNHEFTNLKMVSK